MPDLPDLPDPATSFARPPLPNIVFSDGIIVTFEWAIPEETVSGGVVEHGTVAVNGTPVGDIFHNLGDSGTWCGSTLVEGSPLYPLRTIVDLREMFT
jgi:hypothetical protein